MKRIVLAISLLTLGLMATDFTSMTSDELIALRGTVAVEDRDAYRAEMQDRMTTFTAAQQDALRNSRLVQGKGMGQGQQLQDTSGTGSMAQGAGNGGSGISQQLQDGSATGSMTQGNRGGQGMGRNR